MNSPHEDNSIKKNTIYNIIKTLSSIIFPLITFPYITRVLGPENVGRINFGQSIISYFSLIATLGITTYAVRECSKIKYDRQELGKLASQLYSINICTCIVSYCLLALCLFSVATLRTYRLLIVIQSISICLTVVGADWLNTSMEDFRFITIRTFLAQLISLIGMFLFVRNAGHYIVFAVISVVSTSGANLVNIIYRRRYCKVGFTFNMDLKRHLPPIILLFAMMISQTIMGNIDKTMLGFMSGDKAVGLYTSANKIISIVGQVVQSITWVLMPQLSLGFTKKNYTEINRILHSAAVFTVALGLPCFVGINMTAPDIISVSAGKEFLPAVACMRIRAIDMVFGYINNIFGNMILLPANKEKRFFYACAAAAAVNGVTNYFFIQKWGINGAAITSLFADVIIFAIISFKFDPQIKFGSFKSIFYGPFAGSLVIVAISLCGRQLISNDFVRFGSVVLVSAAAYVYVLLKMKNEFAEDMIVPVIKRMRRMGNRF